MTVPEGPRNKRVRLVHRVAYEEFVGPIPEGKQIDHLCRVRRCFNFEHLEPVTLRENLMRSPIAPAAINAHKTHCPHGHPLDGVTHVTRDNSRPRRYCKSCARARSRKAVA